jgi:HlyD family secretion protein
MKLFKVFKIYGLVIVQIITILSLAGCGKKEVVSEPVIKTVTTAAAQNSSIEISVEYPGMIKPLDEIMISSKIAGRVEDVKVSIGQQVNKGDVLFTLESEEVKAQYNQSQAALESAKANYNLTAGSSLSQKITQTESALQTAEVQYRESKDAYDKTKTLFDEGVVAKQDLDNAKNRFDIANIQLNNAKDNLNLLKNSVGPESIKVASGQVDQAKASVSLASTQLQNVIVTSPISGIVSLRNIEPGELVSGAVPAITIINSKELITEINVIDKVALKLQKNQKISVKVNSEVEKTFVGIIDTISPSADSRTQLYNIKVKIQNPDSIIKSGMFAKVLIPQEKKDNTVVVPNSAIVIENGVQYVYTVQNNIVKKKAVTIGLSNTSITEITSALNAGELVITEGQSFLAEGEKVSIAK